MLSGPPARGLRALLSALLAAFLLSACAGGEPAPDPDAMPPAEPAGAGLAYEVRFEGTEDEALLELLRQASLLETLKEKPPASRAALESRAKADMERLVTVLRSESYYAGKAAYGLDRQAEPPLVTVRIETGPAYVLSDFDIRYSNVREEADRPEEMSELALATGMAARAPEIRDAEQRLLRILARQGFPFAAVADRRIVVDHDKTTLSVEVLVDSGAEARFGAVHIEGAESVERDYIQRLLFWQEGDRFDQSVVEESLAALRATNLFGAVDISPEAPPPADGPVAMRIKLQERPARSIGGGLSWSTTDGFLAEAFWEHRNLAGRNETLRTTARIGELEQSAGAELAKPHYLRRDQTGRLAVKGLREDTEAYKQFGFETTVGLDRKLDQFWRGSAAVSGEYLDIRENVKDEFVLLSLPLGLTRDSRNDLLNPVEGTRLDLSVTPSVGTLDREVGFLTLGGTVSAYWALDDAARFVLAGRLGLATILGAARDDIPASKRLYAGGGGSVRGYGFQLLGPLDAGNDPVGGRSRIESSLEVRTRISDTIGIVPFIDGGSVHRDSYPDFEEEFRLAAGVGLRYFTPFAPLRLDIAFPLDRRRVDDAFQFYVSIGQAF